MLDTARLLGMSYRLLWPPSRVPCVVDHARFQGGRTCQWAGFGRHLVAAIPRMLILAWEVLILQSYVFLLPLGVLQSGWESSNRFIGCSSPPSGVAGCENAQKVEVGASQIVLRRPGQAQAQARLSSGRHRFFTALLGGEALRSKARESLGNCDRRRQRRVPNCRSCREAPRRSPCNSSDLGSALRIRSFRTYTGRTSTVQLD